MQHKPSALVKPTLDTTFHIDYSWWDRSGEDLRVYLFSHLSPEQREHLSSDAENHVVDYVDPDTGEVTQMDELQLALQVAAHSPTSSIRKRRSSTAFSASFWRTATLR